MGTVPLGSVPSAQPAARWLPRSALLSLLALGCGPESTTELPLVSEGAAVALARNLAIPQTHALALEAVSVGRALDDPRVYQTGGRLVRYLLDRFAADSFLRLYRQLGQAAGLPDLDRELRAIYGADAEELWAAVLALQPFVVATNVGRLRCTRGSG